MPGYRLIRRAGSGGSGAVYLAERLRTPGHLVALKNFACHPRTPGEAAALISLDHPGIVRYVDRGILSDGSVYLVMEFVEGEPLDAYATQQALGVFERAKLLIAVAEAVDYAHSRFVIHADLKPANILVTAQGDVRLIDFGLAVALGDHQPAPQRFTPGFSSPEQQFGQTLTVMSDIFSLGATLQALCAKSTPPALRAIVSKACQQDPRDRYRSAQEFLADLRSFVQHKPVAAYRAGRLYSAERWVHRNRITAALVAALVAVLAVSGSVVTVETVRAAHQRRIAQTRLREIAILTAQLQGDLYASLPPGAEAAQARHQLLQQAASTLAQLSVDEQQDPVLRRDLASQYQHLAALQEQQGDRLAAAASLHAASALVTPSAVSPFALK